MLVPALCWPPCLASFLYPYSGVCSFHISHSLRPKSRPNDCFVRLSTAGLRLSSINCSDTPAPRSLCFKLLTALHPVASAVQAACSASRVSRTQFRQTIHSSARSAHSMSCSQLSVPLVPMRHLFQELLVIILPSAEARPELHAPFFISEAFSQPFCCSLSRGEAEPSIPLARRGRTFAPA